MMKRLSLIFKQAKQIIIQEETIGHPDSGQLLLETLISGISAGTESLIYRGQVPETMAVDETIAGLDGQFKYPFKYGYAVVAKVIAIGAGVSERWQNRLVFAFHPHESHFISTPDALLALPDDISPEDAVFLPNMETAVNLIMDGSPSIGENVAVFGQGIVGLLTTALLAKHPVGHIITVDNYAHRREKSLALGAHTSVKPSDLAQIEALFQNALHYQGADLIYELSGNPAALNQAIALAGFNARIIIGSWYGTKQNNIDLGGKFHRARIRLISSQVSTIAPEFSGRWTKSRRLALALSLLQEIQPSRFISHRFDINQADKAYQLLDQHPEKAMQVVLTY